MPERALRWSRAARSRWPALVAGALVSAFAFSLCRRGIVLSDEGYLLLQSLDMLDGKVLYRDMDAFVTPGMWFLHALVFSLFEPSVFSSRILAFFGYLALLWIGYRIVARLATRTTAWCAVGALMVSTVWAFPAWTFSFYSPFSILFALAALERLLAWRVARRQRDLLLTGFLLGLSIGFKQNYGSAALVGSLLGLLVIRLEAHPGIGATVRNAMADSLRVAVGVAAVALPLFVYLASQGALAAAFDSLVIHPFVFAGRQDIPYLPLSELWSRYPLNAVDSLTYGAYALTSARHPFGWWYEPRMLERLHVLVYWIPPLVFPVGVAISLRPLRSRRPADAGLLSLLLVSAFLFLGVFPRADFNHLINVFQPLVLCGAVVVYRLGELFPAPRSFRIRAVAWVGSALFALCTYVAGFWYVHLLRTMDTEIAQRRGGVQVAEVMADLLDFQVGTIREKTDDGEALLTVPDLAMLNFLAERRMPSRYYNLYEHHIAHDRGAAVVAGAESNRVRLAVTRYNNFFSDRVGLRDYAPDLARYLRTHFVVDYTVASDRYIFLSRRAEPLPERETLRVLGDCEFRDEYQLVREHLLFENLYHNFDRSRGNRRVVTSCTVAVPERAELMLAVGYRRPSRVRRGTSLTMEISVALDGTSEVLHSAVVPVRAQRGWESPPFPQVRIDLSRFANREVNLSFRTTLSGAVRMSQLDIVGFAAVWQDPRIALRRAPSPAPPRVGN